MGGGRIWRWGLTLALWGMPQLPVSAQTCLERYGQTGCAARLYAEMLCAHFDRPDVMRNRESQLADRFEEAGLDLAGISASEVETAAVGYYTPMLCPQKSGAIRRLFNRS
jgi:hypothetical protein